MIEPEVAAKLAHRFSDKAWTDRLRYVYGIACLCRPARPCALTFEGATHAFHANSARTRFVKTLPPGAAVLDAGAGAGALENLRHWLEPARPDLTMFAWAGDAGPLFDRYDGSEVGFWPEHRPTFGGRRFDAVVCINFLEHIDDPLEFVTFAASIIAPSGRIYLEWPRPEAYLLPTSVELAALGLQVMTANYFDDGSHRPETPAFDAVCGTLAASGFVVQESGISRSPGTDQELALHAIARDDIINLTLAYWSLTGWCQYLIAERT